MTTIVTFIVAALLTYLLRTLVVVLGDGFTSSTFAESAIGLVSPAVLAAIVASSLILDHGQISRPDLAGVLAVCGALIAVRRTSNISMALVVGFPLYWFGALVGIS